jgi:hypothetical protein
MRFSFAIAQKNPKFLWDFPTTSLGELSSTHHHPVVVRDTGLCNLLIVTDWLLVNRSGGTELKWPTIVLSELQS